MSSNESINPVIRDFAWALLVSVRLFHQDRLRSRMQEHIFIMQWLEQAKRRKIFPVSALREINWFITEGKRLNYRAGLREKAEYIWVTSTSSLSMQSDLRKITWFFDAMKMLGWHDVLVSDNQWAAMVPKDSALPTVYLRKSELHQGFDFSEALKKPLTVRMSRDFEGIPLLAKDAKIAAAPYRDEQGFHCLILTCPASGPEMNEGLPGGTAS